MAIIRSKVQPPDLSKDVVNRERVERLLQDAVDQHRLTLVLAAAGSGKTVAVVAATRGLGRPLIWVSLDRSDTVPGRLLTYLEAAFRAVTESRSVVAEALLSQIPAPEVAGLLAETLPPDAIVVIDNIERLEAGLEAWAVVDSVVRYANPSVAFVFIGRRAIPSGVLEQPLSHSVGLVGAEQLAVTVDEAAAIFAQLGQPVDRAADRVRYADGWMAGVVYGGDPMEGVEADRLHNLLVEKIMADLGKDARDFLIRTAILPEVDSARSAQITGLDPSPVMETIRELHLPITWAAGGASFRLHPRVRDYALAQFARLPLAEQRAARQRLGDLLVSEGELEQAVQEYLQAGSTTAARAAAVGCILPVLERGDLDLAQEWLQTLADTEDPAHPTAFSVARLFIAFAREEVGEAILLADSILDAGTLKDFVRLSDRAGELLAWAYSITMQPKKFDQVVRVSPPTAGIQAILYGMSLGLTGGPIARPPRVNGLLDVVTFQSDFYLGRLQLLPQTTGSRVTDLLMGPFRIAADRVRGRTQAALDAFRQYTSAIGQIELLTQIGPEVLLDAGLVDEAHETVIRGRELAEQKNNGMHVLISHIVEAKILLRGKRDTTGAREVLKRRNEFPSYAVLDEYADLWLGVAMLHEGEDGPAREVLRSVIDRMQKHEHLLELSAAAIYLSEAEWRHDEPDAADEAADLAFRTAQQIDTNHPMMQALADFPSVVTRRLDANHSLDTEWHSLTRPLSLQAAYRVINCPRPQVHFHDVGTPWIELFGQRMQPRLTKTYEVLSYLLVQPRRTTTRAQLLSALFESDDATTRTYLRQALKWLRSVLPDGGLVTHEDRVGIDDATFISSDSGRFEQLVVESMRLRGDERIEALSTAIEIFEGREFLEGAESQWVLQQRTRLAAMKPDLLLTMSQHLLDANRLLDADRIVRRALEEDPLRESGWRLRMRIAQEFHDHDSVIAAFRLCSEALSEIGLRPSAATRKLFDAITS